MKINKFEAEFVRQCSPTLAGLKMANLFRFNFTLGENPWEEVAKIKKQLTGKDLNIEILSYRLCTNSALIYVYRTKKVQALLAKEEIANFLTVRGFTEVTNITSLLHQFSLKLNSRADFPHEIGLLLDYPLADVIAFMKAPQDKGVCTGCWKAYSDPQRAQCFYQKCSKCTQVYWKCYLRGFPLNKLAVAV